MPRAAYPIVGLKPDDLKAPQVVDVTIRVPASLFYNAQGKPKTRAARIAALRNALKDTVTQ
jgi:hypothetical protein